MAEIDTEYLERMEDVLALYEKPYEPQEPVVCLDERPVVLHDDVRPATAAQPQRPAKRDYEYRRCGTANVFCGVEPKAGRHFTFATPNRSGRRFAETLQRISKAYPRAKRIHLVVDNLSTHTRKSVIRRFGEDRGSELWNRFAVHYTPKHASWLNQAEIEISIFARQCLGSRRIRTLAELRRQSTAWNRTTNRHRRMIDWTFTRTDARNVFHRQLQLFKRSQH